MQLTNNSSTLTKVYLYDAFGVERDKDTSDNNPFRYCGEYFDKETGTIYLRARYYQPMTGRFMTEDPIRDGLNWYTYANNNPVMFLDPLGLASVNIKEYVKAMGGSTKDYTSKDGKASVTVTYGGKSQNYTLNSGKIDDSVLNTKFGWENSWIPNGKTQAVYTGVHEVKFVVGSGNYHSSVIIFVAPGSKYYDTDEFKKNKYDGGNVQYATLGAGEKSNKLVSMYNRDKDVKMDIKVQMISMGVYDADSINNLFNLEEYYRTNYNNLNYDLWPDPNKTSGWNAERGLYGVGYNSNSFVSGLLRAAGITPITPSYNVPGFDKPLPKANFGQ